MDNECNGTDGVNRTSSGPNSVLPYVLDKDLVVYKCFFKVKSALAKTHRRDV